MTLAKMTPEMLTAGALRCPITLPEGRGPVKVPVESGHWFAYAARTEVTKKYRKICIDDLRRRQLVGGSYDGDVGHCVIGGKRFSLYPFSGFLVRDDFGQWAEKHFAEFWDEANNCERLPGKPKTDVPEAEASLAGKTWSNIKKRILKTPPVAGLMRESQFNSLYTMKHALAEYYLEIRADEKKAETWTATRILADQLASTIAFREKDYKAAVDFMLDCAADCVKAALWLQETYGAKPAGGTE